MKSIPKTGELYQDFTNKVYQVIAVAVHAETGEHMVIYQAMSGDYGVYARSLRQFMAGDDKQPLFQKIERAGCQPGNTEEARTGYQPENAERSRAGYQSENVQEFGIDWQLEEGQQGNRMHSEAEAESVYRPGQQSANGWKRERQPADGWKQEQQSGNSRKQEQRPGFVSKIESRPRTQSPAESRRALRQGASEASGEGSCYYEKRRRQMEEREQRREMFRKSERHESATEELRANPCLMKFLEADTYEEKFHVLNEIQNDMTDRLIDDIAVVLDVVIPEGALNDRFQQLRNIVLTRQKYETNRFR